MSLTTGSKLGPYEIQLPLEAGEREAYRPGGIAEVCAFGLLKRGLGITLAQRG